MCDIMQLPPCLLYIDRGRTGRRWEKPCSRSQGPGEGKVGRKPNFATRRQVSDYDGQGTFFSISLTLAEIASRRASSSRMLF